MRVTGKYTSKCPVSLQCHKVYWKPKLFSYLIPSHTYMETVVTSQNSITAFGLALLLLDFLSKVASGFGCPV